MPPSSTIFTFTLLISSACAEVYPFNIAPGYYIEVLQPAPVFYESFLPIIFEYNYPKTRSDYLLIPNCEQNDTRCASLRTLGFYMRTLRADIDFHSSATFKGNALGRIQNFTDQCNKIQAHFQGLHIQDGALAQYYQKLDSCLNKGMVLKRNISDYDMNLTEIYNLALGHPANETLNLTANDTYTIKELVDTEASMLTIQALEYARWEAAVHACASAQMIPPSLVTPMNLSEALNSISNSAADQGYKLSIPLTQMGTYLKMPLSDCAFTDAGNFIVRILVPIRKSSSNPRLFKLHAIPFLLKDNSGTYAVCRMVDAENHRVDDSASGYFAESDCEPGTLCLLQDNSRASQVGMCEAMLVKPYTSFAAKVDNVNKFCPFECDKVDMNDSSSAIVEFPVIRRISPNRIIAVGPPDMSVRIRCKRKSDQVVKLPELGALDVGLGCDCAVIYQTETYLAEHPCEADTKITIRLPMQFFNENYLKSGKKFGGNFTEEMKEKAIFESGAFEDQERFLSAEEMGETAAALSRNVAIVCLWVVVLVQTIVFGVVIFYLFRKIDGSMWEHKRFENNVGVRNNGTRRVEHQSGDGMEARIVARNNYDMNVFT